MERSVSLSEDGSIVCTSLEQFADGMMIDARALGIPYLTVISKMEEDVNEITPFADAHESTAPFFATAMYP